MIVQEGTRYELHKAIKHLLDATLQKTPQHAKELAMQARIICVRQGVNINRTIGPLGKINTKMAITIILDAIDWIE